MSDVDRLARSDATYETLFGRRDTTISCGIRRRYRSPEAAKSDSARPRRSIQSVPVD